MADYSLLKSAIADVIKTNGNKEITGQVLQYALTSMINSLGAEFQFAGIATEDGTPGTPDHNVAYLAERGIYPNYGGFVVNDNELAVLLYDGVWTKISVNIATQVIEVNPNTDGGFTLFKAGDALIDLNSMQQLIADERVVAEALLELYSKVEGETEPLTLGNPNPEPEE